MNLDFLQAVQIPSFSSILNPSPDVAKSLLNMSPNTLLLSMGGLMAFRFFGGALFSVLSLVGMLLSVAVGLVCTVIEGAVALLGGLLRMSIRIVVQAVSLVAVLPVFLAITGAAAYHFLPANQLVGVGVALTTLAMIPWLSARPAYSRVLVPVFALILIGVSSSDVRSWDLGLKSSKARIPAGYVALTENNTEDGLVSF